MTRLVVTTDLQYSTQHYQHGKKSWIVRKIMKEGMKKKERLRKYGLNEPKGFAEYIITRLIISRTKQLIDHCLKTCGYHIKQEKS